MNAKKIMGAVLVALLAAALFIGAGAAAADGTDYGTVFIYQANTEVPVGVWTLVGGTATVDVVDNTSAGSGNDIMPGADFVAGTYKLGDDTVTFVKPTASYALTGTVNEISYIVANGGKVYNESTLDFKINALNTTLNPVGYYISYPDGTTEKTNSIPSTWTTTGIASTGITKIQAVFDKSKFVAGVPEGLLLDEKYFSFTVVEADDATISASVDTAFSGEVVTFVVEGTPGEQYNVTLKGFSDLTQDKADLALQEYTVVDVKTLNFTVGNSGKFSFKATVNSSTLGENDDKNKAVVELQKYSATASPAGYKTLKNGKITIKISAPVVTAKVGADSYFIGDEIEISGTSSAKTEYTFNISGINFKSTALTIDESEFGKEWNAVLLTSNVKELGNGKKLDVGTYTIEIIGKDGSIVKTVPVVLKQPFISIISAPEVVVQGTDAEFVINAEATNKIAAYIFGTNYFKNFSMDYGIEVEDEDIPNQFTITLDKDADTNKTKMAAGQYFMVIQHPMYDGELNVTVEENGDFMQTTAGETSKLFNVYDRQTANAAQALCDALDSQNFDDMYVKYSFFVVGQDESFVINEIPTEVAQGTTFTVSGVDTANAGETVTVQMLSTAFAAVPKETAGSAAFILVTTEVADDGTWEVTLDTTGLAVDEYNLAVKIANEEKKTVKINVVEGADTPDTPDTPDVPGTPDTPDTPTEPTTPGFGALAALAGLGAVAVLLLRRE